MVTTVSSQSSYSPTAEQITTPPRTSLHIQELNKLYWENYTEKLQTELLPNPAKTKCTGTKIHPQKNLSR